MINSTQGRTFALEHNELVSTASPIPPATIQCIPVNRGPVRTQHQQQMDGFLYTVFILAFYALTMLYFMLRQICRQEKRSRDRFYRLQFVHSDYAVDKEERMQRAQMKKQLCVHLIKMGQLTQAFVSTAGNGILVKGDQRTPLLTGGGTRRNPPIESITETDSIDDDGRSSKTISSGTKSMYRPVRTRVLTRDQSTATEPPYETIIDIESDTSEVSL